MIEKSEVWFKVYSNIGSYIVLNEVGIDMKNSLTILFSLLVAGGLSGCNTLSTNDVAFACEQGIEQLNQHLNAGSHKVHQANLSRANSLLVAAQVQHQFAEYPGCVEKIQRAKDYLTGQQTAIISRLSI